MNETGTVSSALLVSAKNKLRNTSKQTFEQRPNARKRLRLRSSKVVFHEKKNSELRSFFERYRSSEG
jgi:hypothetical protein